MRGEGLGVNVNKLFQLMVTRRMLLVDAIPVLDHVPVDMRAGARWIVTSAATCCSGIGSKSPRTHMALLAFSFLSFVLRERFVVLGN